jgi:hypothetical protein
LGKDFCQQKIAMKLVFDYLHFFFMPTLTPAPAARPEANAESHPGDPSLPQNANFVFVIDEI